MQSHAEEGKLVAEHGSDLQGVLKKVNWK